MGGSARVRFCSAQRLVNNHEIERARFKVERFSANGKSNEKTAMPITTTRYRLAHVSLPEANTD